MAIVTTHSGARMLEDQTLQNVVSWGPLGDCFVVKVRLSSPLAHALLSIHTRPGHE